MGGVGGERNGGSANPPPVPTAAPPPSQKMIEDFDPVKKPKKNKFAIACSLLASMTSVLLGYDVGVMSGAAIYVQRDMQLSDVQVEILIGILGLYALIGSFAAGRTSDWIGRRYTIVLAGAIFFVGALLMGCATNYAFLMVGRFVAGIGVGYGLMIAPVYTAEVSPASSRGFLTSFTEVFINFGILLGYVSNLAFSKMSLQLGWRFMLGVGAVPSMFLGLSIVAMPESPRWLVMQGRLGDAKKVLDKTSDSKEEAQLRLGDIKEAAGIPAECDDDVVSVPRSKKSHGEGVWRELLLRPTPTVRRILLAGVGIHFFQQITGTGAVVLYSNKIFQKAGIANDTHMLLATVAVGFIKTIFILLATFTIDRFGRRPLLLTSVAGMIASLITIGTALTIIEQHHGGKLVWALILSILGALSTVAWFSIGMGPITWVYSSEVFPLRLRAQGTSIAVAVNCTVSSVILMTFLSLSNAITTGGAFYLFAVIAVVAWMFFYTFLPETQGKTLEEMNELFGDFRWRDSVSRRSKMTADGNGNDNGHVQLSGTKAVDDQSN